MSFFKHKVYGFLFKLFRYTKINKNRISFIIDSGESFRGNLDYIKSEFEKRGDFEFCFFYKDKLSFKSFKNLASSRFIFLNDNFFPLAFMKFRDDNTVVQLWHAPGAFKKFGGSVEIENREILSKISKNTDYLITSSVNVSSFYSEAFQMPQNKIKALGLPRFDYYFKNHDIDELKNNFHQKYNISPDKKIILYAPTFREKKEFNNVFNYLNIDEFNSQLGDEYVLALRLHPKIKRFFDEDISSNADYIDVTDYESEQELLLISDLLITDYSSIMIEYCALNKPLIFFTYDLDSYLSDERGFYFDFKSTVPGPVVYTTDQLIKAIKNDDFDENLRHSFLLTQFDKLDAFASKRIVDFLVEGFDEG